MTTTFSQVPLDRIVASLTNPRRQFDLAKLQELAESIRASGVHQPVLLRPLPGARLADTAGMTPRPEYELVSGERRYRASLIAEIDSVPAVVRPLTDSEVLDIQLVENLQREDLQPLEEAEGYERLMEAHEPPLTAEQIGQRIGKSRSYVYARLKLLNLGPEGRAALLKGWLDASTALLVARMPSHKLQAQALGNLKTWDDRVLSHREAAGLIERQYMLKLNAAPFKIADAELLPSAGSCRDCPKRTGADPDLFADIKGADVCTDPPCYKAKTEAHQERQLKAARESGAQIIEGREAKALIPHGYTGRVEGFLRLDDKDDAPGREKTLRQLIGKQMEKAGITPTLVANPHRDGELIAVITHEQARDLLAAKGYEEHASAIEAKAQESDKAAAEVQKNKDQARYENAWRMELLRTSWAKIDADADYMVPEPVIARVASGLVPNQEGCRELCKLLDLGKVAPAESVRTWAQNHPEPHKALALLLMFQDREWQHWKRDEQPNATLTALAIDAHGDSGIVPDTMAEVKKQHTAEIRARNKVQADKADADAKTPSPPLGPAAQASGGRGADSKGGKGGKGGAKGKNSPAAPAVPKTSEADARTGIAAAMQGDEAGGDCAPGNANPAADGGELEGRATSPDAGASPSFLPGDVVVVLANQTQTTVIRVSECGNSITTQRQQNAGHFVYQPHEITLQSRPAWPFGWWSETAGTTP